MHISWNLTSSLSLFYLFSFLFSLISDFVITVSVFVLPNYFKNGKMAEPNE